MSPTDAVSANGGNDLSVDVRVACDDVNAPGRALIARWVRTALEEAGAAVRGEVSVKIVGLDEMRAINLGYRGQDKPTNVLSFAGGPVDGLPVEAAPILGDIAVCAAVVAEEAVQQNKTLEDHWAHMIVHGTLHLLGFDHVDDAGAGEMEALEARILRREGIADPYRVR